jgi:hypothetical protein
MTAIATHPAIIVGTSRQIHWRSSSCTMTLPAPRQTVSIVQVCDLIEAAGPLTIEHVAGGLDVSVPEASAFVRLMVMRGWLKQDEFGRYRLCG